MNSSLPAPLIPPEDQSAPGTPTAGMFADSPLAPTTLSGVSVLTCDSDYVVHDEQ